MVAVKICGNTNLEDARMAARAGADLLGLVVEVPVATPRKLTLARAEAIAARAVKPVVAVMMDPAPARIEEAAERLQPFAIQFHGDEPLDLLREAKRRTRVIKALHIQPDGLLRYPPGADPSTYLRGLDDACDFILVDTAGPRGAGGTGHTFNWDTAIHLREFLSPPMLLAGGLTPQNVEEAIRRASPWGVDVSSGVEQSPGKKDPRRVEEFIRRAKGL
ncbi:MAG: phosphoribosylanthranilate isomerase [Euryarchaeota archaeon]|nr:phosphoribosylanthranilate isomerase [Euryarchaeota archaeon]